MYADYSGRHPELRYCLDQLHLPLGDLFKPCWRRNLSAWSKMISSERERLHTNKEDEGYDGSICGARERNAFHALQEERKAIVQYQNLQATANRI